MANLKEVRVRITSVNSTRQITSAMKMVSASKLRKAQNAIIGMRPYAQKLTSIMQNLTNDLDGSSDEGVYAADRGEHKVLIVIITSNRGLCGAFNSNIVKSAVNLIEGKYAAQHKKSNVDLMCIGKKGADGIISAGYKPIDIITDIFDRLSFENTVPIAEELMQLFSNKDYDKIVLIYNQFKNAAVQLLQEEQFLPVTDTKDDSVDIKEEIQANFIFEPNKAEILEALVPKAIKVQLYKALIDSFASEHGARMTAMHQATENADEMLKDLKLTYNKARQASITNEILEIVGGAEALKG
ncbi:MAG: ATP synthase F1 subunit gamma [Bacteroidota bacterium]